MKKSLLLALMSAALCLSGAAADTKLTSATVTEVRNEAKLYVFVGGAEASVRPAKVKDVVTGDRALRTGKASRAELEFNDKSIVRLGANTVFSFQPQTRLLKLEKGTILYQQPKGVGATRIATASATCAITGTTVLIQHLTTASGAQSAVYVVLEGSMVVTINGVAYTVQEGYALVADGSGHCQPGGCAQGPPWRRDDGERPGRPDPSWRRAARHPAPASPEASLRATILRGSGSTPLEGERCAFRLLGVRLAFWALGLLRSRG